MKGGLSKLEHLIKDEREDFRGYGNADVSGQVDGSMFQLRA